MLNPTIETDLVGEAVRVDAGHWVYEAPVVLEAVNDDDVRMLIASGSSNVALGDVFPVWISSDGEGDVIHRLHIVRGPR